MDWEKSFFSYGNMLNGYWCWSQFVIFEYQPRCWFADQPVDGNQGVDEGWTLKICRNPGLDHLVVHQRCDASIILIPATTVPQRGLSHSKLILNPKPHQQFQRSLNFLKNLSFAGLPPSSAASWLSSLPRRPLRDRDLRNFDILRTFLGLNMACKCNFCSVNISD